ncbi:MCE family protein [Nocardioides sp. WS12]|uniref:MCE family protein n=1 Tax=Nocardioides sp. WS12 TaxID=2486272 RepID=UPI0015F963D8|nr:MCE family protein [Nocardioides sp. WS12]
MRRHVKPLLGVGYLVVIGLLVLSSILIYRKAMPWQGSVAVELTTQSAGLELNPLSDVKLQGARVGEVRSITSDGDNAVVELALDPETIDLIPANVDARIVPKTLFGEKYVDLVVPSDASAARIAEGDRIIQSRTSVELGELFGRLVPILRTLAPEKVSLVLGSLAEALQGRGDDLAVSAVQLEQLLSRVNPSLDTLTHDLVQLAATADRYADSAPELLRVLDNVTTISRDLLIPREKEFAEFLDTVIGTATIGTAVLRENTERLVTLSGRARPVLALLDAYSAALPCTLQALHVIGDLGTHTTGARGPFVNLRVDLVTKREPYRYPEDLPGNPGSDAHVGNLHRYVPSWKPHCPDLPNRLDGLEPVELFSQPGPAVVPPAPAALTDEGGPDPAVQEARDALARMLAAQSLRLPQDEVPGYVPLLMAPLLHGGQVDVR